MKRHEVSELIIAPDRVVLGAQDCPVDPSWFCRFDDDICENFKSLVGALGIRCALTDDEKRSA